MNSPSPSSEAPGSENGVKTAASLDGWSPSGVPLAVLGFPVRHSISPAMHNAALREMAEENPRFRDWRYHALEVRPEELAAVLPRLHAKGFMGLNLTIPHKILALGMAAAVDPEAAMAGAVNTLLWREEGYHGFNTDGYGLEIALRETLGVDLAGAEVVLLGAGGAARAAAALCLRRGCRRLWLGNRTVEKLAPLARGLEPVRGKADLRTFPLAGAGRIDWPEGVLIINATSAGLHPGDSPPVEIGAFPASASVYDMIYNPPEPALVKAARAAGMRAANGLSMLVHQGVRSLEIWSGSPVPAATMARAASIALGGK